MVIRLVSVSKPTTESEMIPPRALTARAATRVPSSTMDVPPAALRRLAVGKSPEPISPRGGIGLETVFGLDERTRIVSTETLPWKLVCALEIDAPWGSFVGTGWFAGPRTLVTAGHCVFDARQMGGWAREIRIAPGRDRERTPFGVVTATRFSTLNTWIGNQDADFDIAAIHLDAPVLGADEVFAIEALPDAELRDTLVNVSGYPANPGGGQELWSAKNRIKDLTPRRIFYDIDTSGGQSGAPVYRLDSEGARPSVVGIHAYGEGGTPASIPLRVNSAPRMIPEVVEQIQKWLDEDALAPVG
jgi:glutamyl endopeptidase